MSVMTATWLGVSGDRPMTIDDLYSLPDDGNKYELDDGVLVVSPAPVIIHQLVLTELTVVLTSARPPGFRVLSGPGVEISPIQYRIPDLVVVRTETVDRSDRTITRPPVLAVEVASPSTAIYDRNRKKDVYAAFGIASYWIVIPDLEKPRIIAFELARRVYRQVAEVTGDEVFRTQVPFSVEIIPSRLVE